MRPTISKSSMVTEDSKTDANEGGDPRLTRREVLAGAVVVAGGALLGQSPVKLQQLTGGSGDTAAAGASATGVVPSDPTKVPGTPTSAVSARAVFENPARSPTGIITGPAFSPIQDFTGTIFPTDLHFERHHAGVAHVDPRRYQLLVHGLVGAPVTFTLDDLKRFPSVTRVHFLECSGNGRNGYRNPKRELTAQNIDGLIGSAEWTGVPVKTVLAEAGIKREASWVLAEGGDAARLSRSIPLEKMLDDALLVYAQNGEALRPAAGYPIRLLLPGWEGNTCIKWIRRLELIREPNMSRDETSKYTDPLPDGTARQFSFVMDAKSIITHPSFPARLDRAGWLQIAGIAWTGRGKITAVDVSTDGGATWIASELQEPVLTKAITRFTHMWKWDGGPATLMSRAVDETGYMQPSLATFREVRGDGTDFHFNHVRAWVVEGDGRVFYGAGL